MLKMFLKFGKLSRSFLIFVCPLGENSPHEPRIHDQGLLVPGLSENTNTVYWARDGLKVVMVFMPLCI